MTVHRLNTRSWAYKGLTAGGWRIDKFELFHEGIYYNDPNWKYAVYDFELHCVCGTVEQGRITVDFPIGNYVSRDGIDVAMWLEDRGFVGEDHLRFDGFSEEQIIAIRAPMEQHRPL